MVVPPSDVYAAAAVFHECLTGRRPFTGDDVTALRLQHLRAPAPLDDVPAPVRGLLRRGLAKEPADRPGIEDFLADLERSAAEGYGAGWEERGRRRLAELTTLLALLFPFTATAALDAPARALTLLGRVQRSGWKAAAGAAALAVVAGGATAVAARPHDTATTVVACSSTMSESVKNTARSRTFRPALQDAARWKRSSGAAVTPGGKRAVPAPRPAVPVAGRTWVARSAVRLRGISR
ncbi:hypothetical protein [Streptomyces sp. NPDC046197]|uniref:hypothetical protein n=1 Tax=Streptomyces sp. NPDC046197 TaxID=3154337 RepID=UPI0033E181D2